MNLDNISNHLSNISTRDLIRAVGLGPKPSDYILPAIAIFAAGSVVGTMLALLFAPKSGHELRSSITKNVRSRVEDLERRLASWEDGQSGNGRDHDSDVHAA